jgi:hypothetical protein
MLCDFLYHAQIEMYCDTTVPGRVAEQAQTRKQHTT